MTPRLLLSLLALTILAGCTATQERLEGGQDSSLLSLWKTYVRCRTSQDPFSMWMDGRQLRDTAHLIRRRQSSPGLPDFLANLVSAPPSRLSVDPDAMATDCLFRAGLVVRDTLGESRAHRVFPVGTSTEPAQGDADEIDRPSEGAASQQKRGS